MTTATSKDADRRLERLQDQVQLRLGSQVQRFRVQPREHGLVLHGIARTFYGKQLALQYVREETDWPILANEIEVL